MPSKPKPPAPAHDNETDCYGLPEESDIVKAIKAFAGTSLSPRSFRAVQTNQDGSALAVEINTPR